MATVSFLISGEQHAVCDTAVSAVIAKYAATSLSRKLIGRLVADAVFWRYDDFLWHLARAEFIAKERKLENAVSYSIA